MATVQDRQLNSFFQDEEGKWTRRTSGNFRPRGLNVAGIITEVTLSDSAWTALPSNALVGRNALAIQNLSGGDIKINYDSSTVGYVGMTIPNGAERQ